MKTLDPAAYYQQAFAYYQQHDDRPGAANILAAWSRFLINTDRMQSQALFEQSLLLRRSFALPADEAFELINYAILLLNHDQQAAITYIERAHSIAVEANLSWLQNQIDDLLQGANTEQAAPVDTAPASDAINTDPVEALLQQLPPILRHAIQANDSMAAQMAFAQLPEAEQATVALVIQQLQQIQLQQLVYTPREELLAQLPVAIRAALEQLDQMAFDHEMALLTADQQQYVLMIMTALQAQQQVGGL